MTTHVDIVSNDWFAGRQTRVAQLTVTADGHLQLDCHRPELRELILRPINDPTTGDELHAEKDPQEFAERLHLSLSGSHLYATKPYTDPHDSPFHTTNELPMQALPA